MDYTEITAQAFGILGFLFAVFSFQNKKNKSFFIMQALSGLMFFVNFLLIGAISAALFNFVNLIRGFIFSNGKRSKASITIVQVLYAVCFAFSLTMIKGQPLQIFLSSLTYVALIASSIVMWCGNGKYIRYMQFFFTSPAWLVHNVFNFTLGGILCECFNMLSVAVSFIRFGKDGFEK